MRSEEPSSPRTVLVVCFGNLCRSPMAEALLRRALPHDGWRIESAGTHALSGDPPTQGACDAMSRIGGLDISQQRSELLTGDQLADSDFVFTMSRRQAREAAALSPAAASRIRLLGAFAPAAGKASGPADPGGGRADSDEIADPMGGDDAAYAACYRRLNDCVSAVAAWLRAGADPAEAPPAVASWNIHR